MFVLKGVKTREPVLALLWRLLPAAVVLDVHGRRDPADDQGKAAAHQIKPAGTGDGRRGRRGAVSSRGKY